MTDSTTAFREHLVRLLDWDDAHVSFDRAIDGMPADRRGSAAAGFEHTAWQLVEHIRLAQDDILDFCVNAAYVHAMTWPDDYWPADAAPPSADAWADSIASYGRSREAMKGLARDVADLTATVPTGTGPQTYLRAILLAADHAAYHVGQIVAVRRALGIWPSA
ncbi:MAG: DinB family protein [Vicinamibacteraceae bacterium]